VNTMPQACSNAISALSELLSKYNTDRPPNRIYYFDTVLIRLILENPTADWGEYRDGLEKHCGYEIPVSEYPVKETMRRRRMWLKSLRSKAVEFAKEIAPIILETLATTDEHRRTEKQQAIARRLRGHDLLPWEPKAILIVLSDLGSNSESSVGAEGVAVFNNLHEVLQRVKLDEARILLNTIINILAPKPAAAPVDRATLEMQLRIAQAERDSLIQALKEKEEASEAEAIMEWVRQMNSEESRYALDEVFKNVNLVEAIRRTKEITKLPRGVPALIAAARNFFKMFEKIGLKQYGQVGAMIQLTDDLLDEYELEGLPFEPGEDRKVEVVGPGWQYHGETILLPRVRRID